MKPEGRKMTKFPGKRDVHPPKGFVIGGKKLVIVLAGTQENKS